VIDDQAASGEPLRLGGVMGDPERAGPGGEMLADLAFDGLFEEAYLFEQLLRTDAARTNMRRFLEIGGQTREGELRVNELCAELGNDVQDDG
jgi:hypothetical protein